MVRWRIGVVLRRHRALAVTMIVAATLGGLAGAQRPDQDGRPAFSSAGRSPDFMVRQGRFPAEEWFVRDLYARLLRYEAAGLQFRAVMAGERQRPIGRLHIRISEMKSGVGQPSEPPAEPSGGILNLTRDLLCFRDDPCHVLYDLSWQSTSAARAVIGTVPDRYTHYRVSLRYMGQERNYRAYVLFYDDPDGTTRAQVLDPSIPDLEQFASERAPFARAPWDRYVRTRRYAAVVNEAVRSRGALVYWPRQLPIGYVLGDRVTPEDETMVTMSFDACGGQSLRLTLDSGDLRPAGTDGTNSTTVRVDGTPGTSVSIQVTGTRDSGGHIDAQHTGTRHVGTFGNNSTTINGVLNNSGVFITTYTASHIAGPVTIVASGGGASSSAPVQVRVAGLQELGPGTGYVLTGFDCCPAHPEGTNHWGTAAANTALTNIALHYRAQYDNPAALWYNDQSLPLGGKFELARSWLNSGSHSEHRTGINTDLRMSDVPSDRRAWLELLFRTCGSPNFLPEPEDNHWHLRQTGEACGPPAPYDAVFVSQSVPAAMTAGQSYAVSLAMRNTGTNTWTAAEGYKLGSQNPQDNQTWGFSRVVVPGTVGPGQEVTFNFTLTAPSTAGTYSFQWQMLRESVTWFGQQSTPVAVTVGSGGGQPPPSGMEADSAIRGCTDWSWWNAVYQPTANACYDYCAQNGADACEWSTSGNCYVEFGNGCYVQPGFPGWYAAVFGAKAASAPASVRPGSLDAAVHELARRLGFGERR